MKNTENEKAVNFMTERLTKEALEKRMPEGKDETK